MTVPWKYRNVLCPWQTENEIKRQVSFLNKMTRSWSEEKMRRVLRLDYERQWDWLCDIINQPTKEVPNGTQGEGC